MTELSFRVPACEWWSANARVHFHTRAVTAKAWRYTARVTAQAATGRRWVPLDLWTVDAWLAWGDRRMRDPHNYAGTVIKACIDGLVDAGVAVADDSRHLVATAQARHPQDGKGFPPGVYLTVRSVAAQAQAS